MGNSRLDLRRLKPGLAVGMNIACLPNATEAEEVAVTGRMTLVDNALRRHETQIWRISHLRRCCFNQKKWTAKSSHSQLRPTLDGMVDQGDINYISTNLITNSVMQPVNSTNIKS